LTVDGRPIISFASNDYLGLAADPRVIFAAQTASQNSGCGATASRLICGDRPEHAALEKALCDCKRAEAAIVFSSGYQAAVAAAVALAGEETVFLSPEERSEAPPAADLAKTAQGRATRVSIVMDRRIHASLVDGSRLSGARLRTFRHNDPQDLARVLKRAFARAPQGRCLAVCESLYSMDGDEAPLAEFIETCRRYSGAVWLLVDEAHATGVLGATGRGALEDLFPARLPDDVVALGTLSKALGGQGGFVCGGSVAVEAMRHFGRAFMFSTGLTPAAAAAAETALKIALSNSAGRKRLFAMSARLRRELTEAGFDVLPGRGPIILIMVKAEEKAAAWSERLWSAGWWVPAIRWPTVSRGAARLRVSVSVAHAEEEITGLLAAIKSLK
jgi:8-amino-7-oxononanoate synthase